jgi:hypothetical protein
MKALASLLALSLVAACDHHTSIAVAPAPDLEPRADQEAHAAAPTGVRIGPAVFGVAFQTDGTNDFRMPFEAGTCYAIGYAGDSTVEKFSLYLWDPNGKRLDSARGRANEGVFTHCAQMNGFYRLQGKVPEGAGHYAIVVYAGKGAAPVVVAAPQAPVVSDLAALIDTQARSAAPGASLVGDMYAGSAETSDWVTALEGGKCYWFIGAGEPGNIKHLSVYLWDPQGHRLTSTRSDSNVSMVGTCAQMPGMYKFEAKVESGHGNYKLGVYVK